MKTKETLRNKLEDLLHEKYNLISTDNVQMAITEIIDYVKQEVKKQTEELTMRLHLQKLHCKLFHRQKISVWLTGYWYNFKWWIKPMKSK